MCIIYNSRKFNKNHSFFTFQSLNKHFSVNLLYLLLLPFVIWSQGQFFTAIFILLTETEVMIENIWPIWRIN
jgi:hypothetical protein